MSDLPYNLAEYSAQHRRRERRENGWVELVGKREKKWKAFYHDYVLGADGSIRRQQRKRIIGTKAEIPTKAEDLHHAWLRRRIAQPVADTSKAKVSDLCDDYLALRNGDWEEATRKTNQSLFERIIKPAIGHRPIESISAEDLKRLVNELPNRSYEMSGRIEHGDDGKLRKLPGKMKKGISHSYAKKVITSLRAIFDFAQERDLIAKNPARSINVRLKMPKQARKPDKTVFPPQYLPGLPAQLNARDTLIVWLSILGAARPNELFAVRGSDVGPVYGVDFQMLRRSFATVAQFVGLDVKAIQSQLGHARPDMTAAEYMQPIDALTAGQLKRLEDMMRGREPIPVDVAAHLGTVVIQ